MGQTPNFVLRYPELVDAPNVPGDLKKLAEDVDASMLKLGGGDLRIAMGRVAHTGPVSVGWKARVAFTAGWFVAGPNINVMLTDYEGQGCRFVLEAAATTAGFTMIAGVAAIPRVQWVAFQVPRYINTYTVA